MGGSIGMVRKRQEYETKAKYYFGNVDAGYGGILLATVDLWDLNSILEIVRETKQEIKNPTLLKD